MVASFLCIQKHQISSPEMEFGLQLDETMDNNKDAYLMCYVRFIGDNNIAEDILFCKNIIAGVKANSATSAIVWQPIKQKQYLVQ